MSSARRLDRRPRPAGHRAAGPALHVRADLRGRADVVQRPARAATATASTASRWTTGPTSAGPTSCARRCAPASRSGCWPPLVATLLGTLMAFAMVRHRFRGRAATNLFDLPADGHPRDRDRLLAARAVRARRASPARSASGPSSSRTCCSACPSSWSPSRPGSPAWTRAWSRRRWTCTPTSGRRSGGSPSRWSSPASCPRRCCRSRCPSTTSSSPTSTPGRR